VLYVDGREQCRAILHGIKEAFENLPDKYRITGVQWQGDFCQRNAFSACAEGTIPWVVDPNAKMSIAGIVLVSFLV
jgi:hypothetical protein